MAKVQFTFNPLPANTKKMGAEVLGKLFAVMGYTAANMQSQARSNAPWQDQTCNARQGLFAKPYRSYAGSFGSTGGATVGAVLYHTMPYGIYLETRFSGRYRVIVPTVLAGGKQAMAMCRGLMGS